MNCKGLVLTCVQLLSLMGILGWVNSVCPLTFSGYLVICALSLLACRFCRCVAGLLVPWTITATASILVTMNYLHPDISVYSNADYHVLTLQGVDSNGDVTLIGNDKQKSFFDNPQYEGQVSLSSVSQDSSCLMKYNLSDEPLYMTVGDHLLGRLVNKRQLPVFRQSLVLMDDSLRCEITFSDTVRVSFIHLAGAQEQNNYTTSFWRKIKRGYNLYDIVHSGTSYKTASEEIFLQKLRNVSVVRDYDDRLLQNYYLTYKKELNGLQILCDGTPAAFDSGNQEVTLSPKDYFQIGYGSNATRLMRAYVAQGRVCLRYKFPYINNFPRSSKEPDFQEGRQKNIAISSSPEPLLKSNVKEAFYFPFFTNQDNQYGFSGNISYRVGNSRTPFVTRLVDDSVHSVSQDCLSGKNGAVWHLKVCDMRQESPVTGEDNLWVKDRTILSILFILLLLSACSSFASVGNGHRSAVIMTVWLFAIPLFVLRLYLLWRIAVFPPVTDISLAEFLRYRMEMENWIDNPMILTLGVWAAMALAFMAMAIPKPKRSIWSFRLFPGHKLIVCFCLAVSFVSAIAFHTDIISLVGIKITLPVLLYLTNEYICIRWLGIGWRVANAFVTLAALFICDPGYAIMFFIFESIYYAIMLYSFLRCRWNEATRTKAAASVLLCALIIVICLIICFLPQITSCAYKQLYFLGIPFSIITVIVFLAGMVFSVITRLWRSPRLWVFLCRLSKWCRIGKYGIPIWIYKATRFMLVRMMLVGLISIPVAYCGYNYLQNHNLHFKYRAIIHTQKVGEIMLNEDYGNSNTQRLLNAAQNQWFLQYHLNKGRERITEGGIMDLLPHFKKGVTWNTQISDVILSRFVIGELSGLVPFALIVLALVFLWLVFKNRNYSPAGRALTFAIALLFLVQCTFVWMSVTNRTIFFGQDFPFLTQNARFTLAMFGIWLILLVYFGSHQPNYEDNIELGDGLEGFSMRKTQTVFFIIFALLFVGILVSGNQYSKLYAEGMDGKGGDDALEFNISNEMKMCSEQLALINESLMDYPQPARRLDNGEDITLLWDSIAAETHISEKVEELRQEHKINDFTYSLYLAFAKNLKKNNRNSNIIHLRCYDTTHYNLALNKGFFNLQSPEYDNREWKGNIYSEATSLADAAHVSKTKLAHLDVYSIPKTWLPDGMEVDIADCRRPQDKNVQKVLHKENTDYNVSAAVFPVSSSDILEIKNRRSMQTYQYGREEKNLLVKNMIINGRRRFFYPLGKDCFWLRHFANLIAYARQGDMDGEPEYCTIDNQLTKDVSRILDATGSICSVVALDGWGNVRLMADNTPFKVDPNDEAAIEEMTINSYLNPNPDTDQQLFGNLNLSHLNPGPGSSLKPITYAAVTSQSQDIDWSSLYLIRPYVNGSTVNKDNKYYFVSQFGKNNPFGRDFKSIAADEDGDMVINGDGVVNNCFYLSRSSNYYNALITYLGYCDDLSNAEKDHLLVESTSPDDYPRFYLGKNDKTVWTLAETPQMDKMILMDGLHKNFGIPTSVGDTDSLRYAFVNPKYMKGKANDFNFSWVLPQSSFVYQYELKKLGFTERLRQYALGADPVKLTPMKMAELYGKLFSMHPDYHATVTPNKVPFTGEWMDRVGKDSGKEMLAFYQNSIYKGMSDCVKKGTASGVLAGCNSQYHLYAKTGTLLAANAQLDDRMIAVVISKEDYCTEHPDKNRFFVVYLRFKQTHVLYNVPEIINAVINSISFNNYMNQ